MALAIAARGLIRHNNWYLASDQFAFLTFAADLRRGTVFHDDLVLERIAPQRSPSKRYDALSQTYFWRDGRLYSRYPPGFPALLALAGAVAGEAGEHALNPLLYLAILLLVAWLTRALLAPHDRSLANGAAVLAAWLVLLAPTGVHLWGITVVRDLPAHLFALGSLLAMVLGRPILAGLALGAACLVRVDALLYAPPLLLVQRARGGGLRDALLASAAFAAGILPLLLYNLLTEGAPLAFTEGGEFRDLWSRNVAPLVATAQTFAEPSGGGFRLSHLSETLPANAIRLAEAFGWLGLPGAGAVAWALRRRPILVAALLPYPLTALVFFSFWVHPDFRYLAGAALCLIPLVAVGAALAYRRVVRAGLGGRALAVALGAAASAGAAWAPDTIWDAGTSAVALAVGAALVACVPQRAGLARAAPLVAALSLALPATVRAWRSESPRGPFQRAEVASARQALGARIPPGSLLMVAPGLGRPVENLRVYTDIEAFYVGEMGLLDLHPQTAVVTFAGMGRRAFYLLPAGDRTTVSGLQDLGRLRAIETRRGPALLEWFVDPRRAPHGVVLYEVEVSSEMRDRLRHFLTIPFDPAPPPEASVSAEVSR